MFSGALFIGVFGLSFMLGIMKVIVISIWFFMEFVVKIEKEILYCVVFI